jgi:hypothetical protein
MIFRQAKILVDGAELSASFADGPTVEYGAETQDETAHGDSARINKGGLFTATISGGGHCEFGANGVEDILFNRVGDYGVAERDHRGRFDGARVRDVRDGGRVHDRRGSRRAVAVHVLGVRARDRPVVKR